MRFAVAGTGLVVAVVSFEVMFLLCLGLSWFGCVLAGSRAASYRRVPKGAKHD
jgi:hypothetical protein